MQSLIFLIRISLLFVLLSSCDPSLKLYHAPILFDKQYDIWVYKADIDRGSIRLYVAEKDTLFFLRNDVHCVSNQISDLGLVFKKDFRVIKEANSRVVSFIKEDDTTAIKFNVLEQDSVFSLWVIPCD